MNYKCIFFPGVRVVFRNAFFLGGFLVSLAAPMALRAQAGVAAANIEVVQVDTNNTIDSVSVTAPVTVNDFRIRGESNRGDYNVQVGADFADDVTSGVLISCVSENGRDNGEDAFPGTNYCTSTIDYSRTGDDAGSYFVSVFQSPSGAEFNMNVAAAFFSYTNWVGGFARNSGATNGGVNDLFTGSPGLALGTNFIELGGGHFIVNLTNLGIDSRTDGVLLVTGAKNEDNYAMTQANVTNGTWNVLLKDNGTDAGSYEQDPVAFVFVPKTNTTVVSGKFRGDGTRLIFSGASPRYDIANVGTGQWRLTIPGQNPASGVLIVSPEGGVSQNVDNIVSYQADVDGWIIQSRDLPANPPPLQTPGGGTESVASFVFIPSFNPVPISPTNDENNAGASPTLRVAVPNPLSGNVSVNFFGREITTSNTNSDFTIVVLPDTQFYSGALHGGVPAMFQSQTDWIIANRTNLNIAFVSHLGDITQNGQNSGNDIEWLRSTNAMYRLENPVMTLLENGIPYGMTVGNHDQTPIGTGDSGNTTFFNQFFGVNHFVGFDYYGGHYGTNNNNSFQFFSAGGMDFLIIHMEYDTTPSPAVLAWADGLCKKYPNLRVMVTSHWIVNTGFNATFSAQGQAIYTALRTNENFFLMLCGHISGEGQRNDTFAGNTVYSILTDYQGRTNGGNGWLRYYTFSPSNNLVRAFTYSPWLGQFENDADSRFDFPYDMGLAGATNVPFTLLTTNEVTISNGVASFPWIGLTSGKTYQWYAVVSDDVGNSNATPTLAFHSQNVAPSAANQNLTTTGDAPTNLLLIAADGNGDALTFRTNTLPMHGLLQNFDPASGQVSYMPAHGFRGSDRFTFSANDGLASSTAASMNLNVIAPPDTNDNGIPDAWEAAYGVSDPNGDPDGDGENNLQEFIANTNPTNAASALRIMSTVRGTNGHAMISWSSVGGTRYRVQYSDGTNALSQFTDVVRPIQSEMDAAPVGTNSVETFEDDFAGGTGSRFYRIKVVQ